MDSHIRSVTEKLHQLNIEEVQNLEVDTFVDYELNKGLQEHKGLSVDLKLKLEHMNKSVKIDFYLTDNGIMVDHPIEDEEEVILPIDEDEVVDYVKYDIYKHLGKLNKYTNGE